MERPGHEGRFGKGEGPFSGLMESTVKGDVARISSKDCVIGRRNPAHDGAVRTLVDATEWRRTVRELERSEERFRLLAEATREAIWDNDLLTGRQEWAGATEALFGYAPHVGRTGEWWEERVHPEDRPRVLSGLREVLEGEGELWDEEYHFRRADGSYAHVADRGLVVRDGVGRPTRMVGAMRDVTERTRHEEELKRSEELFRRTFEAAGVGMAHLTRDGRWFRVNEKLCEISGYPREELLGTSYLDLTPPEDLEAGEERLRSLLEGRTGPYSVERRFVRKDGSRVWVNLSVSLVRAAFGEPDYIGCVAEDVTDRKIAELTPYPLTPRELEVLRLMAAGCTNPQVALRLSYSLGGIKHHVQHIIAKLGAKNRREAVTRAVGSGLIGPPDRTQRHL